MTADDLIDSFMLHQRDYQGVSARRLVQQRRILTEFADRVDDLTTVTANDLQDYLLAEVERLHVNTVRKSLGMIRPFYSWAWSRGAITAETYMQVRSVKPPRGSSNNSTPRPYTRKELAAFRAALNRRYPHGNPIHVKAFLKGRKDDRERWAYRRVGTKHANRLQIEAIIALALELGLRRAEIYDLTIDAMHPDNEYVVVVGKGNKTREVPFTASARRKVDEWLNFRSQLDPGHERPWLSLRNRVYFIRPMRFTRFTGYMHDMGPYTLHRFRHTCATERLRAGMPLEAVSRLLGHATIQQTLGYAQIVSGDIGKHLEASDASFTSAIAA